MWPDSRPRRDALMFRNLLRPVLAVAAALAVSACSYGSMVDIAPMKSRLSKPAAAPGDYCEVQGTAAPFTVISHEDCAPIAWDQATRTYTMSDPDEPSESIQAAVISLGSGLYAGQISTPEDKVPHQIQVFISKGNAFAVLSALPDQPLKQLAARHGKLTFTDDATGRPYIAAGKVDRIKAFLKDAAKESLRLAKTENESLSVGVLDRLGAPDHPASKEQQKDIEAVLKAAKSLTPK
jgi:hypothetical protein